MADQSPLLLPEQPGQDTIANQFGLWRSIGVPVLKIFNNEELYSQAVNWQHLPEYLTVLNQQLDTYLVEVGHNWTSLSAVNYITYSLYGLKTLLTRQAAIEADPSALIAIESFVEKGATFEKPINDSASIVTPRALLSELSRSGINIQALSSRGRLFEKHEFANLRKWNRYPNANDEIDIHLAEIFSCGFLTAVTLEYDNN